MATHDYYKESKTGWTPMTKKEIMEFCDIQIQNYGMLKEENKKLKEENTKLNKKKSIKWSREFAMPLIEKLKEENEKLRKQNEELDYQGAKYREHISFLIQFTDE